MREVLDIYDLKGKYLGREERQKFYKKNRTEFDKKGVISRKVKTFRLLLISPDGHVYLQKRSKLKVDNMGLYDKTVGGHVPAGYSPEVTVVKECAEELGFAAVVLKEPEYNQLLKSIDLTVVGIFRKVGVISNYKSIRHFRDGSVIIQPFISYMYVGYYDGTIKFKDGESSGIEVFTPRELQEELTTNPGKFTEDIKFMFSKYQKYLRKLV